MTNVKPVLIHELRPGDVFADPSGGESFLLMNAYPVDGAPDTLSLYALQWNIAEQEAHNVLLYADRNDTAYMPAGYPANEPIDYWPTDKED